MSKLLSPYPLNFCTCLRQVYPIVVEKPRLWRKNSYFVRMSPKRLVMTCKSNPCGISVPRETGEPKGVKSELRELGSIDNKVKNEFFIIKN